MIHCHVSARRIPAGLLLGTLLLTSTAGAQIRVQERAMWPGVEQATGGGYFDDSRNRVILASTNGLMEWDQQAVCRSTPYAGVTSPAAVCAYPLEVGAGLVWSYTMGTWQYLNGQWTQLVPANKPALPSSQVFQTKLVYDVSRSTPVLMVGYGTPVATSFWRLLGSSWIVMPQAPGNLTGCSMVYDEARGQVLVMSDAGCFAWRGTAWVPEAAIPGQPLSSRALAFAKNRQKVVSFGGWFDLFAMASDELWEWSGGAWIQVPKSGAWPSARSAATLVYDPLSKRCLLFGGKAPNGANLDDVWSWDGSLWIDLSASTVRPKARNDAMLAEDASRGSVLFGGRNSSGQPFNDTWVWTGDQWFQVTSPQTPAARSAGAMVRAGNSQVILHGGHDGNGLPIQDTWLLDAAQGWLLVPVVTAGLPARFNHAMACDPYAGDRVYMFGGHDGSTQLADLRWLDRSGLTAAWRTAPSGPPARDIHSMTCDETRRKLVVFGGRSSTGATLGDTWEYNLLTSQWKQRQPAHQPTPRVNAGMAFDILKDRTVLAGGYDPATGKYLDDIWEWDGTDWVERIPETRSFVTTENPATCYDRYTHRVVMFGGQTSFTNPVSDTTWELEEHLGKPALPQNHPLDLKVFGLPVVGQVDSPLRIMVPSTGLTALFIDFNRAPTPYLVLTPPLFCSTQGIYVQSTVVLQTTAAPSYFTIPLPGFLGGWYMGFQGVTVQGSCVSATDAWYVKVGVR